MFLIPHFAATSSQSSTLHFTTSALPSYSEATSSTIGEIARHGPHQVAQKSITTGSEPEIISEKFSSVTTFAIINDCLIVFYEYNFRQCET